MKKLIFIISFSLFYSLLFSQSSQRFKKVQSDNISINTGKFAKNLYELEINGISRTNDHFAFKSLLLTDSDSGYIKQNSSNFMFKSTNDLVLSSESILFGNSDENGESLTGGKYTIYTGNDRESFTIYDVSQESPWLTLSGDEQKMIFHNAGHTSRLFGYGGDPDENYTHTFVGSVKMNNSGSASGFELWDSDLDKSLLSTGNGSLQFCDYAEDYRFHWKYPFTPGLGDDLDTSEYRFIINDNVWILGALKTEGLLDFTVSDYINDVDLDLNGLVKFGNRIELDNVLKSNDNPRFYSLSIEVTDTVNAFIALDSIHVNNGTDVFSDYFSVSDSIWFWNNSDSIHYTTISAMTYHAMPPPAKYAVSISDALPSETFTTIFRIRPFTLNVMNDITARGVHLTDPLNIFIDRTQPNIITRKGKPIFIDSNSNLMIGNNGTTSEDMSSRNVVVGESIGNGIATFVNNNTFVGSDIFTTNETDPLSINLDTNLIFGSHIFQLLPSTVSDFENNVVVGNFCIDSVGIFEDNLWMGEALYLRGSLRQPYVGVTNHKASYLVGMNPDVQVDYVDTSNALLYGHFAPDTLSRQFLRVNGYFESDSAYIDGNMMVELTLDVDSIKAPDGYINTLDTDSIKSTSGHINTMYTDSLMIKKTNGSYLGIKMFEKTPTLLNNHSWFLAGAGGDDVTGNRNMAVGTNALRSINSGYSNTCIGILAGDSLSTGYENIAIGEYAMGENKVGYQNIYIGKAAGGSAKGHGNIFIGYGAGYDASYINVNGQLIIDNSSTLTPLIHGDFDADTLRINGSVTIDGNLVNDGSYNFGADSEGSDTYVVSITGISSYDTGLTITFTANTANTGACTINVNSLGAKSLKAFHDQDPPDNYIESGSVVMAVYDGTNFQMIQPDANL